ncbi:MAG: SH3 domain-containing protein [Chloroflexi bacterium]|nr:SH3 domain-containing protein [Chloroflexota bacterium]
MKKGCTVFMLFTLMVLIFGVVGALARPDEPAPMATVTQEPDLMPTKQAKASPTPQQCAIVTGLQDGRVNLRSCGSLGCLVLSVLVEGEPLTILQPGAWSQVRTGAGVTGFVNSSFCK